ncbi:peptidyl-prolyl cis-trans isomerase [Jeotgalibacillus marinus]|uniref:Peptidyl-prolyl cis-trans isomerase n=1 Tax=Jeotgalibacillus marinus TaxID=86667 RepID=A0ABV3Q271_9BACL
MNDTLPVTGLVRFKITLDPGVWIFDDRKVDLHTFFDENRIVVDELEEYTKAVASHFSREIQEGAAFPPTLKTEKKFEKQKILNGTFGILLKPFIENAEPTPDATTLLIETKSGPYSFPLEEAKTLILAFSKNGSPLNEDGPVHVLYNDGSNRLDPITNVQSFKIS